MTHSYYFQLLGLLNQMALLTNSILLRMNYQSGYSIQDEQDESIDTQQTLILGPEEAVVMGNWRIRLNASDGNDREVPSLRVSFRQGGERIRERTDGPSKPLKQWFQERRVPTWERGRLPLVSRASGEPEEVLAVGDLWCSDGFLGEAPATGWRLIVERISN